VSTCARNTAKFEPITALCQRTDTGGSAFEHVPPLLLTYVVIQVGLTAEVLFEHVSLLLLTYVIA
jgi:hypothetical protein